MIFVFRSGYEIPWGFSFDDLTSVSYFYPIGIVTCSHIVNGNVKVITNSWGTGGGYALAGRLHEGWSSEV